MLDKKISYAFLSLAKGGSKSFWPHEEATFEKELHVKIEL